MTEDRSPLIGLVLADDAEYFEQLRGIPKSECNRCKTDENVTGDGRVEKSPDVRQRMRCSRCGFVWSVAVEGGAGDE